MAFTKIIAIYVAGSYEAYRNTVCQNAVFLMLQQVVYIVTTEH